MVGSEGSAERGCRSERSSLIHKDWTTAAVMVMTQQLSACQACVRPWVYFSVSIPCIFEMETSEFLGN